MTVILANNVSSTLASDLPASGETNKITLASGLMANNVAYDINPDTGAQLMVTGYPLEGKLVPL